MLGWKGILIVRRGYSYVLRSLPHHTLVELLLLYYASFRSLRQPLLLLLFFSDLVRDNQFFGRKLTLLLYHLLPLLVELLKLCTRFCFLGALAKRRDECLHKLCLTLRLASGFCYEQFTLKTIRVQCREQANNECSVRLPLAHVFG